MTDLIFSIIIPVYNAETTIRRCLDSFTNQRFSDYEILLINDGSTDNSDAICREYADVNSKICYLSKENGGVSSARNLGLEQDLASHNHVEDYLFVPAILTLEKTIQ